jgi:hypothetical protein
MPGLLVPVIAVLIIVIGGVALYASRETRAETKKTGKHPKGHYMGLGMGIGLSIGVAIGLAMDTIAVGIPIGLAIGAGIGATMEKKHSHELRPMTEKETKMKRQGVMLAIGLLIVTMLIAVGSFYLRSS